jgi:acetyltransferase-like isoleucine patch superfamily enzyme
MLKNFYTKDILLDIADIADIGDYTYGKPRVFHWGEDARLKIGKFCSIADDVVIFLGGNHRHDWVTTYPFSALLEDWPTAKDVKGHPATNGDVVIGNDVWIGYGVTIMSGVNIGHGAVIGAKSVVTKNIEPYSIVAGNPAKEIKKRFSNDDIEKLLNACWWNWSLEKIKDNVEFLCSNNIDKIK